MEFLASLEKQSKPFILGAGALLIFVIGLIDYATGSEFGMSVFYVVPIFLITWGTQPSLGYAAALVSAVVWLVAEIHADHAYSYPLVPYWNSLIRLAFFLIIAFLLSALKRSLELARSDYLTTAINSRFFYELLALEIHRFQRHQRPFTVVYFDLDNFKAVNDRFGHKVGDEVLVAVASSIRNVIRKSDFIARLGGDEFAVFFPETDQQAARVIFSKIQSRFIEMVRARGWPVTFSVGVLTCVAAPPTTQDLMEIADRLMYLAKADGKNTVKYSTYAGGLTQPS